MKSMEELKKYANSLMFDMAEQEYQTLQNEFESILKEMNLINAIEGLEEVEPMTYPFILDSAVLREDVEGKSLSIDELLANADSHYLDQIKVPKVVE